MNQRGTRTWQARFNSGVVAASCMLAGCAQTTWVREGTSFAEAQAVSNRCGYEADLGTPVSNVHVGGRPTIGKAIAEGLMGALEEGIRKSSLQDECMVANGFHREAIQPSTTPAQATATAAVPNVGPSTMAAIPVISPVAPAVSVPRSTMVIDQPRPQWSPVQANSAGMEVRQVITERFMNLPDTSKTKISFLAGACSAGDETACIMGDWLAPAAPRAGNARADITRR